MPTKDEIKNFSKLILDLAHEKNAPIMDTIVSYCEDTGFELELAASLLTSNLKSKIEEEAESLNLMKKKNKRLPL